MRMRASEAGSVWFVGPTGAITHKRSHYCSDTGTDSACLLLLGEALLFITVIFVLLYIW